MLSESVAKRMRLEFREAARETANFVEKLDKFFDTMNVRSFTNGIHSLKPFQMPYRWANDFRIKVIVLCIFSCAAFISHFQQWLREDFLVWLKDWEEEVNACKSLKSAEQAKMMLSRETHVGLQITNTILNNSMNINNAMGLINCRFQIHLQLQQCPNTVLVHISKPGAYLGGCLSTPLQMPSYEY